MCRSWTHLKALADWVTNEPSTTNFDTITVETQYTMT